MASPDADRLLAAEFERVRQALAGAVRPRQDFNLTLSVGQDESTDVLQLLSDSRRVLLQGGAGAGKSVEVYRAALRALDENSLPVVVNLKDVDPFYLDELIDAPNNDVYSEMDALLSSATPPTTTTVLKAIPNEQKRILFLDGMNELYGEKQAQWVFDVVEDYLAAATNTSVVVTDRPTQRRNLSSSWKITKLNLVSPYVVREQLEAIGSDFNDVTAPQLELLRLPFFLNVAVQAKNPHFGTAAEALSAFFGKHLHLSEHQRSRLMWRRFVRMRATGHGRSA